MEVTAIFDFFNKGGLFMYPIMIVFAVGMAITIERWLELNRTRSINSQMWNKIHPVLEKGEFDKAREMVKKDRSVVSKMLGMGLARLGAVRRREDIEIAMEESMMEIIPQLEKRTPYVALLANIATLLGLLGTIMGLIEAFTAVANANPAEKADLLSASISNGYDLTKALSRCKLGLVNFYSEADVAFLVIGTTLAGNVDGVHGPSAGQSGFKNTAGLSKLYQIRLSGASDGGLMGAHGSTTGVGFVSRRVAPWLRAASWPAQAYGLIGKSEDKPTLPEAAVSPG